MVRFSCSEQEKRLTRRVGSASDRSESEVDCLRMALAGSQKCCFWRVWRCSPPSEFGMQKRHTRHTGIVRLGRCRKIERGPVTSSRITHLTPERVKG